MNIRSNEPFWLVKNGLLHSYPSLRENMSCEVLVGGGDENFKNPLKRDALLDRKKDKLVKTVNNVLPELNFIEDFC